MLIQRCITLLLWLIVVAPLGAAQTSSADFPRPLDHYPDPAGAGMVEVLQQRAAAEPFNVVATAIFILAILHTFLCPQIRHWAHVVEERHLATLKQKPKYQQRPEDELPHEVSFWGQVLHFFGEVEVVFGIWAVALAAAISSAEGLATAIQYIGEKVSYNEALFVVIIMTLSATRPVLRLAEQVLRLLAGLGGGSPAAWWLTILMVAPVLGSFITEPAAMTIAALLLGKQFYELGPSRRLRYATLGLLFVNVSVGGTLTHFAAPPVLMVAAPWNWGTHFMLSHFGWKAAVGIVAATLLYYFAHRTELRALRPKAKLAAAHDADEPVPVWVTTVHLAFLAFTVWMAHYPVLFIGAFLFFLAFTHATAHHQSSIELRGPILVGFFLAGLVIHGGLQGWWIEPVLKNLGEVPLFIGATVLTAFNDNAAITYLATLVPGFTDNLKYAVVAGAVTGGGLTVIANAPNPAGQSILARYFPDGISPLGLLLGALLPTVVLALAFIAL
jgi:hypothetical protein